MRPKNNILITQLLGQRLTFIADIVHFEFIKDYKPVVTNLRTLGGKYVHTAASLPVHLRPEGDTAQEEPAHFWVRAKCLKWDIISGVSLKERYKPGTAVVFTAKVQDNSGSWIPEHIKADGCHFSNVTMFKPYNPKDFKSTAYHTKLGPKQPKEEPRPEPPEFQYEDITKTVTDYITSAAAPELNCTVKELHYGCGWVLRYIYLPGLKTPLRYKIAPGEYSDFNPLTDL
jgi:hypothetical protein